MLLTKRICVEEFNTDSFGNDERLGSFYSLARIVRYLECTEDDIEFRTALGRGFYDVAKYCFIKVDV